MVRYESGKVMPKWYAEARGDGHKRSKTFPGIAEAMANQWTLAMRPNTVITNAADGSATKDPHQSAFGA